MAQAPTVQRAIMNRHHQARRSNSSIAPKLEPGAPLQSPQSRPTPSSHASSPTSNSPGFHNQGVMTPPASDSQMQFQQQQQQRLQAAKSQPVHGLPGAAGMIVNTGVGASMAPKGPGSSGTSGTGGTPVVAAYYPSPFQNHIVRSFCFQQVSGGVDSSWNFLLQLPQTLELVPYPSMTFHKN
jgi:hypothetical protein